MDLMLRRSGGAVCSVDVRDGPFAVASACVRAMVMMAGGCVGFHGRDEDKSSSPSPSLDWSRKSIGSPGSQSRGGRGKAREARHQSTSPQ